MSTQCPVDHTLAPATATETRQYGEGSLCVAGGTRVFTPSLPVSGSDTVLELILEVVGESEENVEMMSCDCRKVSRGNLCLCKIKVV